MLSSKDRGNSDKVGKVKHSNIQRKPLPFIETRKPQPALQTVTLSPSVHTPPSTGVFYSDVHSFLAGDNELNSVAIPMDNADIKNISSSTESRNPYYWRPSNSSGSLNTLVQSPSKSSSSSKISANVPPSSRGTLSPSPIHHPETPQKYIPEEEAGCIRQQSSSGSRLSSSNTLNFLNYNNQQMNQNYDQQHFQQHHSQPQQDFQQLLPNSYPNSYHQQESRRISTAELLPQYYQPDMQNQFQPRISPVYRTYSPQQIPPTPPFNAEDALRYFGNNLTQYEIQEVRNYKEIYFTGSPTIQKIGTSKRKHGGQGNQNQNLSPLAENDDHGVYNEGYDDVRGDFFLTKHDHVSYRYEILGLLGKGSFGQVAKVFDHKLGKEVALKIIRNKKRFEKQGVVEVKVLDRLRKEDIANNHSIVHMLDYFYFRGHLCITFELLGINLYEWLKAGGFRGVHIGVIKSFTRQMLNCLCLLADANIVHCDLKPENVLLADVKNKIPGPRDTHQSSSGYPRNYDPREYQTLNYGIKVIDFGSSCFENEKIYTYVQSRFYRSPEVILGAPYSCNIDMWSLGCILVEMYTGSPLFPGESENEQLACIMEVKGIPDMRLVDAGTRKNVFFENNGSPKILPNSKGRKRRPGAKSLASIMKCGDLSFIDFIQRCLEWLPERRLTPQQALNHEWFVRESNFAASSSIPSTPTYQTPINSFQQQPNLNYYSVIPPATSSSNLPSYQKSTKSSSQKTANSTKNIPPKPNGYAMHYNSQVALPPLAVNTRIARGGMDRRISPLPSYRNTNGYQQQTQRNPASELPPISAKGYNNASDANSPNYGSGSYSSRYERAKKAFNDLRL